MAMQHTLLLVDDEESIISALRRLFLREGYQVLAATSGANALTETENTLVIRGGMENAVTVVGAEWEVSTDEIDTDGDGQPDAYSADPTNYTYAGCTNCTAGNNWSSVVTAHINVLARSVDMSPGHQDTRTYRLGLNAGGVPIVVGPKNDRYRRNVYSAMVRIANPAGRRDAP